MVSSKVSSHDDVSTGIESPFGGGEVFTGAVSSFGADTSRMTFLTSLSVSLILLKNNKLDDVTGRTNLQLCEK